jgi:hypothetical protein
LRLHFEVADKRRSEHDAESLGRIGRGMLSFAVILPRWSEPHCSIQREGRGSSQRAVHAERVVTRPHRPFCHRLKLDLPLICRVFRAVARARSAILLTHHARAGGWPAPRCRN